jgi:hypothetical protein
VRHLSMGLAVTASLCLMVLVTACGGGAPESAVAPVALSRAAVAKAERSACDSGAGDVALVAGECLRVLSALAPQRLAAQPLRSPTVLTMADLLTWAEKKYPEFFAGAHTDGFEAPFTYRHYQGTDTYLAVDSANDVYVLGPLSGYKVLFIAPLASFTCSVYASQCDIPGNSSTTLVMQPGTSTTSSIEFAGDTDWFAIYLTAGQTYTFDLEGSPTGQGTLDDPLLQLVDSQGGRFTFDDDSGTDNNSRIIYSVGSTGWYYLSAQAFETNVGSYRLTASVGRGAFGVVTYPAIMITASFPFSGQATDVKSVVPIFSGSHCLPSSLQMENRTARYKSLFSWSETVFVFANQCTAPAHLLVCVFAGSGGNSSEFPVCNVDPRTTPASRLAPIDMAGGGQGAASATWRENGGSISLVVFYCGVGDNFSLGGIPGANPTDCIQ